MCRAISLSCDASRLRSLLLAGLAAIFFAGLDSFPAKAQALAFVSNVQDSDITVINTANGSVVATVQAYPAKCGTRTCYLPSGPGAIAVTPDGNHAWVANVGADFDSISVISTVLGYKLPVVAEVLAEPGTPEPAGCAAGTGPCHFPTSIAFNPVLIDSTKRPYVYVANHTTGTISVLNSAHALDDPQNKAKLLLVSTVLLPTGANPAQLAVTPNGKQLWVTDNALGNVYVIDTGLAVTKPNTAVVQVLFYANPICTCTVQPSTLGITPDGTTVIVTGSAADGTGELVSYNTTTFAATNINILVGPQDTVAVAPDAEIFVASASTIFTVGFGMSWSADTLSLPAGPHDLAITPDSTQAYVTNPDSNSVTIVNLTTAGPTPFGNPIPTGEVPSGIAIEGSIIAKPGSGAIPISGTPIQYAVNGFNPADVGSVVWDYFGDRSLIQTTSALSVEATPYLAAGDFSARVTVLSRTGATLLTKTVPVDILSPVRGLYATAELVNLLPNLSLSQESSLNNYLGLAYQDLEKNEPANALTELAAFVNYLKPFGGGSPQGGIAAAIDQATQIGVAIKASEPKIGVGELSPPSGSSRVGDPVTFTTTWTVPDGKSWRTLQNLDLRLVEARHRDEADADPSATGDTASDGSDPPIALWARFNVGNPSTFSLLDDNGNVVGTAEVGTTGTIETDKVALDLSQSSFQGTGPTGPSVTVNFAVRFKVDAAGHYARRYRTDVIATDLFDQIQASDQHTHWVIRPEHED